MPTISVKHGDFTYKDEQIAEIAKNIEVVNKKKAILGNLVSPATINGTYLVKRRQVLVDPTAVAVLTEGGEPTAESIKLVNWEEPTQDFGSYIRYTRRAYNKNRDSIVELGRNQLSHSRLFDTENTIATAFNSGTAGGTIATDDIWGGLSALRVRLTKNGAVAPFYFVCTPEIAMLIAKEAKASGTVLSGTQVGADVAVKGAIGEYAGFIIVEDSESYMYGAEKATNGYALGTCDDGTKPVKATPANVTVISHEIGSAGSADPTDEFGTIAARVDSFGAYLERPECLLKVSVTAPAIVAKDVPAAFKPGITGAGEVISPAA